MLVGHPNAPRADDSPLAEREPPEFPPHWADAWGDDRFGLWAEFSVADVRQRMRWIEAGAFRMGSPEGEPERSLDEGPGHLVRLSRGFWLADTACTQAMWLAVTGSSNPSRFPADLRFPVENVSWDDAQGFLRKLEPALGEGTQAALPTEAQWEYASRAGTETPFAFGGNVSPEQVNYDGNLPYDNGAKGVNRGTTVAVKSLPANAWGLFEMHGNVWEWCADGLREYVDDEEDPRGPVEQGPEALRALRGGSWFLGAWFARSAFRYALRRDDRGGNVGFRFALRS